MPTYDPLYLQGIEHFNACDFFEAHEVWEALWADDVSDSKRFLQGLIQAAVALHHFGNGNLRGAKKLYESCRKYLEPYAPEHMGMNLDSFLGNLEACFRELLAQREGEPPVAVDPERIPEIRLE